MTDVREELLAFLKVKPKKGETEERLAERVFEKGNNMTDDRWSQLSPAAQKWFNSCNRANDKKQPFPLLDGSERPRPKPVKGRTVKTLARKTSGGAKTDAARPGRPPLVPLDKTIKIVESEPPFRKGTIRQKVFAKYRDGMTVPEARKAGVPFNHMRWHVDQGWVALEDLPVRVNSND